ncbi:L domain-like protein [Coccomyxa subellipsoidea C-169]|uniref:L domain-like protein n=1 Tax=Coccomyxa subellipsoidea (strain C-169) TaxID=574566 RepID=I0YQ56_COCSC|nr:L domain-like protein [Coccomyxa subellipsoidea C-169]EIE20525.1 L domain-like protein [Coccomyxa subellipsoidea C-169]|eukprot:XP_005645069.1 L domain-like protein [Coccomyxa subellipsoidea C-169]
MSQKLTPKLIRKLFPEQNSKEIERLNVSAKDIVEVGDLTTCPSLIRLDLSLNNIQDTNFATTCQQIKWLSLANNPIADVLNVGHAKLAGKIRIQGLDQLGLKRLPNLNTLVLKQNAFKELGTSLHKCGGLQKLSMAHNQLSSIGDALSHCTALKELRLNHNAIDLLPAELAANSQLRILDLGDNPIADTDALKVLAALPWLRNLNLKSCGVSQTDDYPQSILRMLPNLDVLDNKRARDGTQAKQKKKRGVPEQEMQDVGEQTCMRDGAAEKDSVGCCSSGSRTRSARHSNWMVLGGSGTGCCNRSGDVN